MSVDFGPVLILIAETNDMNIALKAALPVGSINVLVRYVRAEKMFSKCWCARTAESCILAGIR